MSFAALLVLAVGLAMDATAAAAIRGVAVEHVRPRDLAFVALLFGGAQAVMPLIGWAIGARLGSVVRAWDHWIAFGVLGAIGTKMIWDSLHLDATAPSEPGDPLRPRLLLALAFATSIDALAVGVTLPLLDAPLLLSVATIGLTTAVLSAAGLYAGRRFGALLEGPLDAIGGIVLIGIGALILVRHLGE